MRFWTQTPLAAFLGFSVFLASAGCDFQKKSPNAGDAGEGQEIVRENPEALKPAPEPAEPEEAPVIERVPVSPESMPESVPSSPPEVTPEQQSGY